MLLLVVVAVESVVSDAKPSSQEMEIKEAVLWVESHKESIPVCVFKVVLMVAFLHAELEKSKARGAKLLETLRCAMGITPKSEKGKPKPAPPETTDEATLQALKDKRKNLSAQIKKYEERVGKAGKDVENKLKGKTSDSDEDSKPPPVEPSYTEPHEKVFTGCLAQSVEEKIILPVNRDEIFQNPKGLHSTLDERTRHEHVVTTKTITLKVETVTDPRTGISVTASTDDIGPPNTQVTWVGIANTIIAVIGYAIPINRLATMLQKTCPYFTSTRLCSHLKLAAEIFHPIYIHLGEHELPNCDVFRGDDTKANVVEIKRDLENNGQVKTPKTGSLIEKVAEAFGRVFKKKKGKGTKRSLNTSVVIGKTVVDDPRSYIFFFRTHLGSFGDLLTKILENRSPRIKSTITIVSDLATTNLVSAQLYKLFTIVHAGCSAHARRPFWKHQTKDGELCGWMLSAFLILQQIEERIDDIGRNKTTILRYRNRFSLQIWKAMLKRCESVVRGEKIYGNFWPKTSELYLACEYIVNHYAELTRYILDPRLPSDNNLSERVLRWGKIMEDASKFRNTEGGRLNVDILTTILHTCSAAKVELVNYLIFVFKNRDSVANDPGSFTPYAYALMLDKTKNTPKS